MIQTEPITKTDILNALNNLAFITLENEYKEKCERCRLCNQLISSEDEKIPLTDGACYNCTFGPTGDPEDTEER